MTETKTYEIVTFKGQEARQYPDGTIRSHRGYVLARTSESAREMVRHRWMNGQLAAMQGLQDGLGTDSPEQGWRKIIAAKAKGALEDNTRAGTEMARFIGYATGLLQQNVPVEHRTINQTAHIERIDITPDLREFLKQLSTELGEVIEGETHDNTE